jgi:hypothetical protein
MRELEIGDLSLIVRDLFGLPDDADAKVVERLKHMRKLAFPSATKAGQGHRRTYGITDVVKVAVAFQLVDTGLASTLAVRIVAKHWLLIAAALGRAIGGRGGRVHLTPNVIMGLSAGGRRSWEGGTCRLAGALSAEARPVRSAVRSNGIPSPTITLDLSILARSLKSSFRRVSDVATDEVESELAQLAYSRRPGRTAL